MSARMVAKILYLLFVSAFTAALTINIVAQYTTLTNNSTNVTSIAPVNTSLIDQLENTLSSTITAYYEIRVGNKTVAEGIDPVTKHFLNAALGTILGDQFAWQTPDGTWHYATIPITWTDWNGNTHTGDDDFEYNGGNPTLQICYTTQSTYITYTTNTIPNAECLDVMAYNYVETDTQITVTASISTVFTTEATIYAIGLRYTHTAAAVLIAAEALNITIPANTTVAITYTITITKEPPFTNNAYHVITQYMLGAKAYGYSATAPIYSTTGSIIAFDTGWDYWGGNGASDESYLALTYVSYSPSIYSVDNLFSTYMSVSYITTTYTSINGTNCEILVVDTSNVNSAAVSVNALAIIRHVDRDGSNYLSESNTVVAVIPLGTSVTSDAVGVSFGIGFCGS